MYTEYNQRRSWKVMLILLTMIVILPLITCACWFQETRTPERSFKLDDLLIDQNILPLGWELTDSSFPTGDTLCTGECITIGFEVKTVDGKHSIQYGGHDIYRYRDAGIARRTFEKVYLSATRLQTLTSEWTYQSSVADRSHFGCRNMAGNVGVYCEWGAQYEEYIVVFGVRLPLEKISSANIEQIEVVIRAIDERMMQYIGKSFENGED